MKKFAKYAMFLSALAVGFTACDDDNGDGNTEPDFAAPTATAPGVQSVTVEEAIVLSFTYNAEAGFKSSSVTQVGGATEITTDGTAEATDGTIEVTYTANAEAGAGTVVLTVVDGQDQTVTATAVVNKVAADDAIPAIAGIPASATVDAGQELAVSGVDLTFADGFGAFTLSVDGGAAIDLAATIDDTSGSEGTADIAYATGDLTDGGHSLVFTLEDGNGTTTTFTHTLTVNTSRVIESNVTSDVTWYSATTYELGGRIAVEDGATLTIQPGTVIKGQAGAGANSTVLIVARGGKLMAEGTAESPIIFTSVADNIVSGQIESPNLEPDVNGLWGGLIVLGNAPIAASSIPAQIEGIPTTDPNGLYGGTDPADNSGVIKYVSVRHGGTLIGSGNEINGITLGGVGSGTVIENVEVVANQDDGIEWFGGNVDVTNALIWNAGDDGLDTDQDWIGTCENFIIVTPDGSAFELDGPEGGVAKRSFHSFTNGIVYAGDDIDHLVDWDGSTNAVLTDIYFYGWSNSYGFIVDEDPEEAGDQRFIPFESFGGDMSGTSTGFQYTMPTNGRPYAEVFEGVPDAATTEVALNANTVGPDAAGFAWTWASQSDALSSIGL
ncbi:hypothetical protein GCM10027429_05990 [Marivirga atlantica]|jgi:hypothetical protein|uniref:Lipoprotein n=1 Tax=Marivirga atlantica TaxID=1548457 RepID=A0A937DIV5_9BACT|nr:hypothetical protein [Marivirga atlantica]MBL0764209.1 hypothetical protein [Marivirga atlantica]